MKMVFFGTADVAVPILNALNHAHQVIAVITSPDAPVGRKQVLTPSPVAIAASTLGLPILKPTKVKDNPELYEQLRKMDADIFIVVAYGKILPKKVIDLPELKTVNVHFSLLPKYRGAAPIQYTLLNGESVTGTTLFVLDERMDTGPVLSQKEMAVEENDDYHTLSEKLSKLSITALIETLPAYQQGVLLPYPQNESNATYTRLISKDDGMVNWRNSSDQIYNQHRAFKNWPGIWTTWNGETLKIIGCVISPIKTELAPGTVHEDIIACGNGTALHLSAVQAAGGTKQSYSDFLRGHPNFNGSQLGK